MEDKRETSGKWRVKEIKTRRHVLFGGKQMGDKLQADTNNVDMTQLLSWRNDIQYVITEGSGRERKEDEEKEGQNMDECMVEQHPFLRKNREPHSVGDCFGENEGGTLREPHSHVMV